MIQPEINKAFSQSDLANFIIDNDEKGLFVSAKLNRTEFLIALRRLDEINHIIVFQRDGKLKGVFGYFFVTEENKHLVGKQIWRLPENLIDGDILYLAFIITIEKCDVLAIKKMFEDGGYRKKIKKIRGFSHNHWYEHSVRDL